MNTFAELVTYLDQRFEAIDQKFVNLEKNIDQKLIALEERINEKIDRRFVALEADLDVRFGLVMTRIERLEAMAVR